MGRLYKGNYVSDNSDLLVEVLAIYYQTEKYAKVKINLKNKNSGVVYEKRKRYKLDKKRINHWKRASYLI